MDTFWGVILFLVLLVIYLSIPSIIKARIIRFRQSRQLKLIQAQTKNQVWQAEHPSMETDYTFAAFIVFGWLYFNLVAMYFIKGSEVIYSEPFKDLFFTATLYFILVDIGFFIVRMALGFIQGAVIFDPVEKKIYAFGSVNSNIYSDDYKEYHESELVFTKEMFGGRNSSTVYVFFTKENNDYAFKVDSLGILGIKNRFGEMLSQQEPADIHIPFKCQFHPGIIKLTAILIAVLFTLYKYNESFLSLG